MTVEQGDAFELLAARPTDSVDLVVTDPPYNLSTDDLGWDEKEWDTVNEDWDRMSDDAHSTFTRRWVEEVVRVLRPGGSAWTFSTYHNRDFVGMGYRAAGLDILNEVVWYKRNAMPNVTQSRLTASHETILWGAVDDDYTFNYDAVRSGTFDRLNPRNKQLRTVWDIPTNKDDAEVRHGTHPTQKPLSVVERIFEVAAGEGDVVLDPFAGSGTTLVAAVQAGCDAVGYEQNPEYAALARDRLADQGRTQAANKW